MNELTYSSYLKLDQLLALQSPRSDPEEHDELLFIIVHQAYELWFKLMLHELEKLRGDLFAGRLWPSISTVKRLRTITKVLVEQVDIVETLTPMSFGSFRDRLDTASGFQSAQFREFEYLLGYKRPEMVNYHPAGGAAAAQLQKRLREPAVIDALDSFLKQHAEPRESSEDTALRLYKSRPDMEVLFEVLTDLDEGQQEWRYRHVKLVERTIGSKKGTGGSLGVDFLKKSLFLPVFPVLWAIRHRL